MSDEHPGSSAPLRRQKRGVIGEVWAYMRTRKKWWLAPIVVILLALAALAAFTETSVLAPFIYTVF